jgi:hypothetical protein
MGRDAAAPTGDDHCLRLSFSSQHNTFRLVVVFLVEEGRGWSGVEQHKEAKEPMSNHAMYIHTPSRL